MEDLIGDIHTVSGMPPSLQNDLPSAPKGDIIVGTAANPIFRNWLETQGIDTASLENRWERFRIQTFGRNHESLLLCGSDERGTLWAIYEFCHRWLGVDPLGFWTDLPPPQRVTFSMEPTLVEDEPSTFRFRGWFINDEDLLTEWKDGGGRRNLDYPYYHQVVHEDVMKKVIETALRLKMNLLIPASFLDIMNPPEENLVRLATRRGLFVSQHHIEPVGVSHFALERYWMARGMKTPPSYTREPEKFEEVWTAYVRRWAKYPNVIWQIGLRGRGDSPVWANDPSFPQDMASRGRLISKAMERQRAIIQRELGHDDFLASTTLWEEGTALHLAGHLHFPDGIIVVIADNRRISISSDDPCSTRPFAHTWADDFYQAPRHPQYRYGIYYHPAFWGSGPHLAQGVPLEKIHHQIGEAVKKGDTVYAIYNVSNIRENVLAIDALAQMSWNYDRSSPGPFWEQWCRRQFGAGHEAARQAYEIYYEALGRLEDLPSTQAARYHDGVIRHDGLRILNTLHRHFLKESKGFLPHTKPDPVPPGVREYLDRVLPSNHTAWERAYQTIHSLKKSISEERRPFYRSHLLLHAHIHCALTGWAHKLLLGLQAIKDGPVAVSKHTEAATHELGQLLESMKASETGRWIHWYRGDKKLNIPELLEQTQSLSHALQSKE